MSWELVSHTPHPALRPYVRRCAGYTESGHEPVRRREPISGDVVLIVSCGPSMRFYGGVWDSFLVGMHAPVSLTEHDGVALRPPTSPTRGGGSRARPAGSRSRRSRPSSPAQGAISPGASASTWA